MKNIAVLSGDKRQIYANSYLNNNGFCSYIKNNFDFNEDAYILCGTPFSKDSLYLNCDLYSSFPISTFIALLKPGQTVFAGNISSDVTTSFKKKNINYFDFFIKKAKTVLLPFLLVTTPFVLYSVSRQSNWGFSYESVYMKGYAWLAYWYIPFVMVLFAASPFYSLFTKLQTKYQLIFFLVAAFISIGFGRYDHNVFLSLIFLE